MFRGEVDLRQLEERLSRMGLVSEWRAFGGTVQNYQGKVSIPIADRQAFAVEFLGMVVVNDARGRWSRKARRIWAFIISVDRNDKGDTLRIATETDRYRRYDAQKALVVLVELKVINDTVYT